MFKRSLFLGITAGVLAAIAALIYAKVYYTANEADFSRVASNIRIVAANIGAGVAAAIGFWIVNRLLKKNAELVFNLLFALASFATLLYPIGFKLPLDLQTPELFPGMVIPMYFFPALAWFTIKPAFFKPTYNTTA